MRFSISGNPESQTPNANKADRRTMDRQRLRALLASGSNAVFDCRLRAKAVPQVPAARPFFEQKCLANTILLKQVVPGKVTTEGRYNPVQTLLFMPFDPKNPGDGGRSIPYAPATAGDDLRRAFDAPGLSGDSFEADLQKLSTINNLPNYSPFLVKDALDRAKLAIDPDFIALSDKEAEALKDSLRNRLKILAAKSLDCPVDAMQSENLDLLVHRLWALDQPEKIYPLSRVLRIPDYQAVETLYAWIGVSYFETEYLKREKQMLTMAQWMVTTAEGIPAPTPTQRREHAIALGLVRGKLKTLWREVKDVFARYNESFSCLVHTEAEVLPFIEFLKTVRRDFWRIGELLLLIDQCISIYDAYRPRAPNQKPDFDKVSMMIGCQREVLTEFRAAA